MFALLPPGGAAAAAAAAAGLDDIDSFVARTYKRVIRLEAELARSAAAAAGRGKQRHAAALEEALDAQRRQLAAEHVRALAASRDAMEMEVCGQLRRQAAAHADHVKDSLDVQRAEVRRAGERAVDGATELAAADVLHTTVRSRAAPAVDTQHVQALWLACCALKRVLEASECGVYTEAIIQRRFFRVEEVARRTVPPPEEASSAK